MNKLREFTNLDWYGWQGANNFADGSTPLIAEGNEATLIACGVESEVNNHITYIETMVSVYFGDEGNCWCYKCYENKESALEETEILLDLLDVEFDESKWRELGFEIIGC